MNQIRIVHVQKQEKKPNFNWSIVGAYIGLSISFISVFFTSQNLKETEKWKKNEFIASQYEKFNNDSAVIFITNQLNYYSRAVKLKGFSKPLLLNINELSLYLLPDSDAGNDSTTSPDADSIFVVSNQVRDLINRYLGELSLFYRYIHADLFSKTDIEPYLKNQIDLIGDKSKDESIATFQDVLWWYIDRFKFYDVQKLLLIFGYNITNYNTQ